MESGAARRAANIIDEDTKMTLPLSLRNELIDVVGDAPGIRTINIIILAADRTGHSEGSLDFS